MHEKTVFGTISVLHSHIQISHREDAKNDKSNTYKPQEVLLFLLLLLYSTLLFAAKYMIGAYRYTVYRVAQYDHEFTKNILSFNRMVAWDLN